MAYCIAGNYTIQNCLGVGIDPASHALDVVAVGTTANVGAVIANFRNSSNAARLYIVDEDGTGAKPGGILSTTGYGLGLYSNSPSAAIKFYAGGCAAGNEMMRICGANGYVGIGTTTINSILHISQTGQPQVSCGLYATQILQTDSQANYQRIRFDRDSCAFWGIGVEGQSSTNDLIISGLIGGKTSGTWSDNVFRIKNSDGNVVINGSDGNPLSNGGTFKNLVVYGGTGYGVLDLMTSATATNSTVGSFAGGTTGASNLRFAAAVNIELDGTSTTNAVGRLAFYTATAGSAVERMRITSAGNVGIGNTSPGERLVVDGGQGVIQLRVDNSDGSTINVRPDAGRCGWVSFTEDAVADRWGIGIKNADSKLYFSSGNVASGGGTTRMVLDGTGSLGIGTVSPNSRLHVVGQGAANTREIIAEFRNSANTARIDIRDEVTTTSQPPGLYSPTAGFGLGLYSATGPLIMYTNGTGSSSERLRINTSGCVGIGTTSPSYLLHVNGTFYAAGSSIDYKEEITTYNTDSCLFMCLKPKTYQYKDEWKHLGKELKSETQIGLIAEEVAEVMPELAVLVNEDDNKVVRNVDYEKLSIVLLAEVQKLRKEVDTLKQSC